MEPWQTLLITGAFTLLGVWLGSRLSARSDHLKWLREQKQQAYTNFLADAGLDDMGKIIDGDILKSEYLTKQFVTMQRLTMLVPDEISDLAREVAESANKVARALADLPDDRKPEALEALDGIYPRAVSRLTFAMRLDLHRLPLRTRLGYKDYLRESDGPSLPWWKRLLRRS